MKKLKNLIWRQMKKLMNLKWRQRITKFLLVGMLLIGIGSLYLDLYGYELLKAFLIEKEWWDCRVIIIIRLIIPDDMEMMVDAFYVVWGAAITIGIFLIEISGNYRYGTNLKTIVELFWTKGILKAGEAFYLSLLPMVLLSSGGGFRMLLCWCLVVSFSGLMFVLWFAQKFTRKEEVQELIMIKTKEDLVKALEPQDKSKRIERSADGNGSKNQILDAFPVTDFMIHINMMNKCEQGMLVSILEDIFTDENITKLLLRSSWENTILLMWGRRIVSGVSIVTENEKENILDLFCGIWEKMMGIVDRRKETYEMSGIKEHERCSRSRISYSIQLLIPFIDLQNKDGTNVLVRLWKRMSYLKTHVLVYLLLYSEYRYWFVEGNLPEWLKLDDYSLKLELKRILKGRFYWEESLGKELWIDWGQCNGQRNDVGIKQFYVFCSDLIRLKNKKPAKGVILNCF